jgi:hypothetical protein
MRFQHPFEVERILDFQLEVQFPHGSALSESCKHFIKQVHRLKREELGEEGEGGRGREREEERRKRGGREEEEGKWDFSNCHSCCTKILQGDYVAQNRKFKNILSFLASHGT